jgi:membrane protein YdbS with pleckstrin-like domain
VDPYTSPDDTIHAYAAWHYTVGWGNLFTVTVAVIAIIASVTVNVITLRRNASHFEQGRIDVRNDKLRAEVIDLISALSERRSQVEIVMQRIRQLENVDRQAIHQNIEATFSDNLWDSYRRITAHAFAVLALTEDKEATEAIGLILRALGRIRKLVGTAAANPSAIHLVDRAEADKLSHEIDTATEGLKSYAVCRLGVAAHDEHGHPLNKLDVLLPE